MARFMADISGQAGPTSRLGSVNSGISSHTRGWDVGVRVDGEVDDGEDKFYIYATLGSNGGASDTLVAILTARDITLMAQRDIRKGLRNGK